MNRLKVIFVTPGYPSFEYPFRGIFTHRSVKVLSRKLDVQVLHLKGWMPSRPIIQQRMWDGIPVCSLAIPHFPARNLVRINAMFLSEIGFYYAKSNLQKTDLIHSTGIYPIGWVADKWARRLNKVHVSQAIGGDVNIYLISNPTNSFDWLYSLDGISCNSHALRDRICKIAPGLPNVKVIYRGVNTDIFCPDGYLLGPQVDLPPVKFLYLGGFQTWNSKEYDKVNYKGGHIMLEGWRLVEGQLGNSSLIIGGPGIDFSRLESWRVSLAKPHRVHIQPVIKPEDVPAYLRAADVIVIPSITDGLPNLANEAQACGRPVLGSDAGGIPETVVHQQTGLIVARGNPQALAQGLIWFYEHSQNIQSMGIMARQRMLGNFSLDTFSEKMMSLFEYSLNKRRDQS